MDGQMDTSKHSSMTKTAFDVLRVMVVDDDIICLSVVAGILKMWKYEVVTVKSAEDALLTLRARWNYFHLVVTDVHMPKMDGFELQRIVHEEFKLPVVMMSADEKESSILRGLEAGAVFYIVKPVTYDDLKDLWQYAVGPRKGKSVVIREIESAQEASLVEKEYDMGKESLSLVNKEKQNKRDSQRKAQKKLPESNGKEKSDSIAPKKPKVVWTTALHNGFLEAIRRIGLERAVPKRILEHMNAPGLTRENVASHLQKYRLFLKRVTETSSSDEISGGKNNTVKALRSSFAAGYPSVELNSLQPRFLGNIQITNGPKFSPTGFPTQQVSSMDGPNPMQMYQRQAPAGSDLVSNAMSNDDFAAFGLFSPDNIHGTENIGSFTNSNMIADLSQMGFASGGASNGFDGSYYTQGAYSSTAFGSTNQLPPRISNAIQQDNIPMLLPQHDNLGNGGGENSYLLNHPMNNMASMENIYLPQFDEGNLDGIFLNQLTNPSYNEQHVGEEVQNHGYNINSNAMEQDGIQNYQFPNQREFDGGIMGYNFGNGMNQLDDHFLGFNPSYPNQQQEGREFMNPEPYNGYQNVNQTWNQGGDDILDSSFGPGRY